MPFKLEIKNTIATTLGGSNTLPIPNMIPAALDFG